VQSPQNLTAQPLLQIETQWKLWVLLLQKRVELQNNYKIEETGGKSLLQEVKRIMRRPIAAGRVSKNEAGFTFLLQEKKKWQETRNRVTRGEKENGYSKDPQQHKWKLQVLLVVEMEVFSLSSRSCT